MERYQRVGVLGRGGSSTVVLARLRQPGPSQEELAASGAAESPPRWRGSSPSLRPRVESEDPAAFLSAPTPSFSSSAPVSAALAAAGPAALLRVIKEVDLRGDERHRAEALREAEVLKSLAHPNIIAYHEALLVDTRLCIVMEYADGGDLAGAVARRQKAARRFLEREAMAVFVQLAIALQYIHNRRILHRDLKSKNAFLTKSGVVKLGDFGIAKVFDTADSFTETLVGTPYYLPPEMCANLPYAFPADIWCLGVVFYELLALEVPFSAPTVPALAVKICTAEPHPVQGPHSVEAKALLGRMLSKRQEERPTSAEILQLPHVRRSAAAMLAATSPAAAASSSSNGDGGSGGEASSGTIATHGVASAGAGAAGSDQAAQPGPSAGGGDAAAAAGAAAAAAGADGGWADFDLEALLSRAEESLSGDLSVPMPDPPLSPTRGAEAAQLRSSLQHALDSTMTCERLLHELEQEFNFG
eukprot:CAMPEP_0204107244 /NCGR_PEP_ID=MMETSP0361-20130328/17_1 /ASSEMBLY_ACC=CAM_ASM_000343 /TAXON_ID=268821 /ORGANISM="Scrippsiella Hangoei, Strain SHTV-5" /LENGTH=472 /DNA_ID=CAMNT_0051056691 /DNA_START=51 /DNA_END=1469 /DNA_ORIENTATION=+